MRRVYYDARAEANASSDFYTSRQRITGAKDLLSAKVADTLTKEGWTVAAYHSRQTLSCFMSPAGFEAGLPTWSSVNITDLNGDTSDYYIIADYLPEGYDTPTGYKIYHVFNSTPTAQELVSKIAQFTVEFMDTTIERIYYDATLGWRAEIKFNTPENQGPTLGIGISLRTNATDRGGGGYSCISMIPSGTASQITMYHGANASYISAEIGIPDVRFGKTLTGPSGAQGGYFGNIYPVYIFATPYTCSIVPVTDTQNWQSVHCGALKNTIDSCFGLCCYSYRKWMKSSGVSYGYLNGTEYIGKNIRLIVLKYKNLNYQTEAVKWLTGEAQLSDCFVTIEGSGRYDLMGKMPYSYELFDMVVPDDISYSAIKTLIPLTQNLGDNFDQNIGTLIHRCS